MEKIKPVVEETEKKINLVLEQFVVAKCSDCGVLHCVPEQRDAAVRCGVCGEFHLTDGHDYIAVSGNITKGLNKGLVGNNLNENNEVMKVSIFCIKCFGQCMHGSEGEEFYETNC